jgi:stage III sporulation protein AB
MILKIIGAVIVCASSALLGFYLAYMDSFRAADLSEWKKALLILRSEIAFASVPLPEAAESISHRVAKPVNEVFQVFAKKLSARGASDTYGVWQASIGECRRRSYMEQEDWDWILSFGKTLGYLDKSMQLNSIDLAISYIDTQVGQLNERAEKNKKMYGSLGIFGGLLTVVILL